MEKCSVYRAVSSIINTIVHDESLIMIDLIIDMNQAIDSSVLAHRNHQNFAIDCIANYNVFELQKRYPGYNITLHGNCLLFNRKAKL